MFDIRTRQIVRANLAKPWQGLWNLLFVADPRRSVDQENADALLNYIFCMPESDRRPYLEEIEWLKSNQHMPNLRTFFPYPQVGTMPERDSVITGAEKGFPYVIHRGRRLFFPRKWERLMGASVRDTYLDYVYNEGLLGDGIRKKSPHCYQNEKHRPRADDVLLDIGCAEALYAFDWVETVRKVYLFESERFWRLPLMKSFAQYHDKTVLVDKYVGDGRSGSVRLEDVVSEPSGSSYFIKMDIEGAERFVIESSRRFLTSNKVRLSVCCYHRQDDELVLSRLLKEMGYEVDFSEGYTLPSIGGTKYPFFRRGVIYARNY